MHIFSNPFEKKWFSLFFFLYVLIMLPLPFYFSTVYIPSFHGTPLFVFGWIAHGFVTIVFIYLWWKSCMKRPEYQQLSDKEDS